MIGGHVGGHLAATMGDDALENMKHFQVDKAFIGVGGVNVEENFISNFNYDESFTKNKILKNSKKNYIVMNDEKFYKDGSFKFGTLDDINYIITEKEPEDSIKKMLVQHEVKIIF